MNKLFAGLLLSTAVIGAADAATVVYTSNTIANAETDFTSSLGLQRFDGSQFGGATLDSLEITLFGNVSGAAGAENRSTNSPAQVTLKLAATITLKNPVTDAALVVVIPAVNNVVDLGVYDRRIDYDGTSGVTLEGIEGTLSNTASFTDPAVLSMFSGTGSVATPFTVAGTSSATGPGNLASFFDTFGGGYAQIAYTYSLPAAVPEPATWAMMIGGFGMIGYGMRRKKVSFAVG